MSRPLASLLALVCLTALCRAENHTIYLSNAGNNTTKCGTLEGPCASIIAAWRAISMQAGDHVELLLKDPTYNVPPLTGLGLAAFRNVSLTIRSATPQAVVALNASGDDGTLGPLQLDTSSSITFRDLQIMGASLSCRNGACPSHLIFERCSFIGDMQVFGGNVIVRDTTCHSSSRLVAVDSSVSSEGEGCRVLSAHLQVANAERMTAFVIEPHSQLTTEGGKVVLIMLALVATGLTITASLFFAVGKFGSPKVVDEDEDAPIQVLVVPRGPSASEDDTSATHSTQTSDTDSDAEGRHFGPELPQLAEQTVCSTAHLMDEKPPIVQLEEH